MLLFQRPAPGVVERRVLRVDILVELHVGGVRTALENGIDRRIGEDFVELRHGAETLAGRIALILQRDAHQQADVKRVAELAPLGDLSVIHVIFQHVEIRPLFGQQGVGLLEFFEHVAVNLLLAVVGRIELAFGIPLTGLEVGRIAERIGDVRERQHFEDAGNGQPVLSLSFSACTRMVSAFRPSGRCSAEVVDDRVVEAVVVDALGRGLRLHGVLHELRIDVERTFQQRIFETERDRLHVTRGIGGSQRILLYVHLVEIVAADQD